MDIPLDAADLGIVVDEAGCSIDDLVFCGAPEVTVPADVELDEVVAIAVARGWVGVEALTGIAGTITDAVRTNASAHGQAIGDTVSSVRTRDRTTDAQRTFPAVDCRFVEGGSRLGERLDDGTHRYDVLDVRLLFRQGDVTAPITGAELAARLGVPAGSRVPLAAVREVLAGESVSRGS